MHITVDQVFTGDVAELPDGSASAIYKRPVSARLRLTLAGLDTDNQANSDAHGGPARALHHYPAENHEHWARQYEDPVFGPGVFGENISTHGVTEAEVHVGDIFTLGSTTLVLAQPRQPCFKPGTRLGHKDLAREIVAQGRAGWFYRVLEPGEIAAGDTLTRIETAAHGITLAQFWALANTRNPDSQTRERLAFLADYAPLADEWQQRLARRLARD